RAHAAFAATGLPYAADAWDKVTRHLDGYGAAWVGGHTDACLATRVRGEQSERALDLRMVCLGQRLAGLRAAAALFAAADRAVVEGAVATASALPGIAGCADLERLSAPLPLPDDPTARSQVAMARTEVAVADAYRQSAKYKEGLALIEPALVVARAAGYP